jgi:hypothetical protein
MAYPATRPIASFRFILLLHVLFLLSYVMFMPAFEGADEPEHLRYIEAVYKGEKIHPIDTSDPRRYGIEVYQPPLYYHLAAWVAKAFPVVFPDHLAINPEKNPNRPFLVHDMAGEIFPFDGIRKTLRFFRMISLLLGILAFIAFARVLALMMPENASAAAIILLVAALWPNNLQMFSVVSNDGMAYLLSLTLILVFLHILKSDTASWKYGLCFGTTLAAGILTKMTILLTVAALMPVLLADVTLDRRRAGLYLRLLPAVFLPVLILCSPFILSRTLWYGSPTAQKLHNILVPAVLRGRILSFGTLLSAMVSILPGRFLADLCWQQMTLPFVSLQLFLLWFFSNLLFLVRVGTTGLKKLDREKSLHRLWVASAFVFMFLGLYGVFAKYVHLQIRHVWNLWPMTLLAPCFLFQGWPPLRQVNKERVLSMIFAGVMLILVPVNILVIYNFTRMYKPVEDATSPDLDYFVFMDCFAQSPLKATAYVDPSGRGDAAAYAYFARTGDWENVLYHACAAMQKGFRERESRLMAVRALQALGRSGEEGSPCFSGPGGGIDTGPLLE